MNEDLLQTNVTIDRGNFGREVIRNWDNSSQRQSSDVRQLGCKFQDMNWVAYSRIWSRQSLHRFYGRAQTYGRRSDVENSRKLLHVPHTLETKNLSLGMICPGEAYQRSSNAPKFEDRSQEKTQWQEQGAREAAWKLAKNVFKIKGASKSNILLTFGK